MSGVARVVVLANRLPLPCDDGWRRRTVATIDQLSAERPTVLLINSLLSDVDRDRARARWSDRVQLVGVTARRSAGRARILGLVRREPYLICAERTPQYVALVARHTSDEQTLVFCVTYAMAAVARAAGARGPLVIDTHNIDSEVLERYGSTLANPFVRWYARDAATLMRRTEDALSREAQETWVCSDREATQLGARELPRVHTVPNGVELPDPPPTPSEVRLHQPLIFFGHLEYRPNVDALVYLAESVWPALQRIMPRLRLTICGPGDSTRIRALFADTQGVDIRGRVEDIGSVLRSSAVAIVPLRIGGGTRLKILEAMGHGLPVVSTTAGAEGIAAVDGASIAIADNAELFARRVGDILADLGTWATLSRGGRALIEEQYTWQTTLTPHVARVIGDAAARYELSVPTSLSGVSG